MENHRKYQWGLIKCIWKESMMRLKCKIARKVGFEDVETVMNSSDKVWEIGEHIDGRQMWIYVMATKLDNHGNKAEVDDVVVSINYIFSPFWPFYVLNI